jgi:beta-glucanase (GH16 family)
VFEVDSIYPTSIRHNVIKWDTAGYAGEVTSGVVDTDDDFRDFHIHGALWTETGVLFYIDGVMVSNLSYGPSTWVHDYLNIWMTCIAYNYPPDNALLPSQVNTDYINYYQKDFVSSCSRFPIGIVVPLLSNCRRAASG